MKAVILAGGLGTRLSEETDLLPKPMIEIGGRPVLWHILKIYSAHGINDFVICCGYKGYIIKEYFANYFLHMSDVTFDMQANRMEVHQRKAEPWRVTLVDTGTDTMTGGRLLRVRDYLKDETFCLTYGDGVSDVNIGRLLEFHKKEGRAATVTAVRPSPRFGAVEIADSQVRRFHEKPATEGGWINGGFFVFGPKVFKYLGGDEDILERQALEGLTRDGELSAYLHEGFWQPMDTLREKKILENLWASGKAPWKQW